MAGAVDGFEDAPLLIGVNHEFVVPADLFADDVTATEIFGRVATYFEFEVGPAFGEGLLGETADFFFAVAEPANGGGVGRVTVLLRIRRGGIAGLRGAW